MSLTDHQSTYLAYELTRRAPADSLEKLAAVVAGAQVDLNPHQVDAALFAFRSPLSKGAVLADEVGLGKTIEAGLVLSQYWAERRRNLLVITPASLRKQWYQELSEKFFLPCQILESGFYKAAIRDGNFRPFYTTSHVIICSYEFAKSKASDIAAIPWDLVVIDEAHRLRNVYQSNRIVANTIKRMVQHRPKLLLTATPLQNSLLELFGLVSIVDEHVFGSVESFRDQFLGSNQELAIPALKARLAPVCTRTLRRQVQPYVSYTNRLAMVEEFTPEESEDTLYELVSEYLKRPNLQALPAGQRSLMTLVLRKLLASSTFAIAGALETMSNRLKKSLGESEQNIDLQSELANDYDRLDEAREEWPEDSEEPELSPAEREAIRNEIRELESFAALATSITKNAKGEALLKALSIAMDRATELGAARKAIIFTESRRTQNYLLRILEETEWSDRIVLFNGSNTDAQSKAIYDRWLERHRGSDRVTGSRTADMRSALVDYFRDEGQIMIATEAAAEGINLQFCSLVVNYDLPWNPQRIEQRIGRCHRYGQKHDVVVLNFLNRTNAADQRVYELLSQKFKLFDSVFGASDEVLGSIESSIEFEKKINEIYQSTRTTAEINEAFRQLQLDLEPEITAAMSRTRQKLLENFDDEVREKLRVQAERSAAALSRHEQLLMLVTRHELADAATFHDDSRFELHTNPFDGEIPTGLYELPRRSDNAHIYRTGHPLAEAVLGQARNRELVPSEIWFNLTAHEGRISALEPYIGKEGVLSVELLSIEALDQREEHLLVAVVTDDGEAIDPELARRMLLLPAKATVSGEVVASDRLEQELHAQRIQIIDEVSTRNLAFFNSETQKLDSWADDLKQGLEREIKELDRQIREAKKASQAARTLEEKLAGQKEVRHLESHRNQKRKTLFDAQDTIDAQRDDLIGAIEARLSQNQQVQRIVFARWRLD